MRDLYACRSASGRCNRGKQSRCRPAQRRVAPFLRPGPYCSNYLVKDARQRACRSSSRFCHKTLWILQATSTKICVLRKSLKKARRGFDDSSSPSASLPIRDILYSLLISGRKPAERGLLRPFVRTTASGLRGRFGPFSVSLGPLSPTQPNHGHFGTDVESSIIQRVEGAPKR